MKSSGYIRPTQETAHLWRELLSAKERGDRATVGRLSQQIRQETQRNGHNIERHSGGNPDNRIDCGGVVDG